MRFRAELLLLMLVPALALAEDKELKPISAEEAAKQVDKECLVEMQVKSIGKSRSRYFLNSEANFRDGKNFTIFIDSDVLAKFKKAKIEDPATYYKDKTIRVKGKVLLYNNRPEIKVAGPEQVEVVDKKK
jgi:DNA/RNA endonuclease YhcR with UshA esterase domain